MPGETFEERCAWASRTELANVYTVTRGTCSSSSVAALPGGFFPNYVKSECSGGEPEIFFVGSMYQDMEGCLGKPFDTRSHACIGVGGLHRKLKQIALKNYKITYKKPHSECTK